MECKSILNGLIRCVCVEAEMEQRATVRMVMT